MRKVIQLTAMPGYCVPSPQPSSYYSHAERVVEPTLYALCDDGSVWAIDGSCSHWLSVSTKGIREGHERNTPHHGLCLCDECVKPTSAAVPEPEKE